MLWHANARSRSGRCWIAKRLCMRGASTGECAGRLLESAPGAGRRSVAARADHTDHSHVARRPGNRHRQPGSEPHLRAGARGPERQAVPLFQPVVDGKAIHVAHRN